MHIIFLYNEAVLLTVSLLVENVHLGLLLLTYLLSLHCHQSQGFGGMKSQPESWKSWLGNKKIYCSKAASCVA